MHVIRKSFFLAKPNAIIVNLNARWFTSLFWSMRYSYSLLTTQDKAQSEEAIKLKPNEYLAAREIRQAEEERWKMKHGKEPQFIPVKTALPYNCTNTVPVLPPR